jgi:hypothetical protein
MALPICNAAYPWSKTIQREAWDNSVGTEKDNRTGETAEPETPVKLASISRGTNRVEDRKSVV